MQRALQRIIERNNKNIVQINSFFNEQGLEDWFIKDKPKKMFTEDLTDLSDEGVVLSIHYNNAIFSFWDRDYVFYVDEFKNYISLGSKKHEDHFIIIEFIKE